MRFTLLFLRRPRGTLAVCACLLLLGVFALKQMPVNLYPHVEYPVLTISTELSESSPEELEATVTKPIEEAIADIPGLKKIEAVSREGESQVTLQFHHDQKIAEKAMEVRSRIRRIFPLLPKDARFPVISRFDPSDTSVVVLAVTGDASLETVGHWVNEYLKPQLSRIDGVATVRVAGAPRRQILVECDTGRLQAQSLTISDVVAAITTSHASIPGGIVVQSGKNLSVITQGKLETPEDVSTVSLKLEQDGPVLRIGEIARVRLGSEERKEITRFNGRDLITVLVYRSTAADLRAIWKSISEKLDQIPHGSEFTPKIDVILNKAEEVERILARLWVILGITAAIMPLVLFAFLRTVRSTIVVLLAIPFSMLTTILAMQLLGVSLDMMSLGGLTLGIGILVDNAIVVAESISRRRSEGNSETDAVVLGTGDVAVPVILATAATIVVFLPVLFVSREIGLLFKGFAWTVGVGLFFSMIAAMILVPVLLRYIGGKFKQSDGSRSLDAALSLRYGRLVNFLEAHRLVVVSSAVCLLILGVFLSGDLSYRRALITEVRSVRVVMVLAPGTATERTAAEALAVEQQLMKLPFVKGVHSDTRDNQAILTVSLKAHDEG